MDYLQQKKDLNRYVSHARILLAIAIFLLFMPVIAAQSFNFSIPVNQTDVSFNFSIDKEVYDLGETVHMTVQPTDAIYSIVVIDENDEAVLLEDLEFTPSVSGIHQVDALLYLEEENVSERFKINFEVISEATVITDGNVQEETIQYRAVVGDPVKYKKTITVSDIGMVQLSTVLPLNSTNIEVYKMVGSSKQQLQSGVYISSGKTTKTLSNYNLELFTGSVVTDINVLDKFWNWLGSLFDSGITGRAVQDDMNMLLEIKDLIYEPVVYEITYESPAPQKLEEVMAENKKQVTIYSEFNYTNIIAGTSIDDKNQEEIKLYWLKDTGKQLVNDVMYFDNNNNGFIDEIKWIVPHLSNQTYEVVIGGFGAEGFGIMAVTNISACTVINARGVYTLNASLAGAPFLVPWLSNAQKYTTNLTCIYINSSNVSLDCMGNNISNIITGVPSAAGILVNGDNITIQNCPNITGYEQGLLMFNGTITLFRNLTLTGNVNGVAQFSGSNTVYVNNHISYNSETGIVMNTASNGGINLTDNMIEENMEFDFLMDSYGVIASVPGMFIGSLGCIMTFQNNTGSGNRPILLTNNTVNWADFDNVSEIILCTSDYSNLTNITIRGSDTLKNNGLLVFFSDHGNFDRINSSNNYANRIYYSKHDVVSNSLFENNANRGLSVDAWSYNTTIINCTFRNTLYGFFIQKSDLTTVINTTHHGCTAGLALSAQTSEFPTRTTIINPYFYNNALDFGLTSVGSINPGAYNMTNALFDGPLPDMKNYTVLDIYDNVPANEYYFLNWSANPSPGTLPTNYIPLHDKFIEIVSLALPPSISSITWHWNNSELNNSYNYTEEQFELIKFNSSNKWEQQSFNLDTNTNTISVNNLAPASVYAVTEAGCVNLSDNNTWWMKIYNNSGVLTLIGNTTLCRDVYTDLPISIPSDNLQLDCGGALLKGLGSGNAVIISGQNVLVENCIIKTYGVGISSSSNGLTIINNSIFNNTDYGLNLGGDNLNISHNYVYNSSHAASTYNIFSDGDNLNFSNNVIVLSYDSCLAADGNNNVFINNSAYYCDLQSLNGGAFEIGGTNHLIMYNHAENSSNGLYIEGRYNNITNNTVQGNILGINLLGYGNRVYNNTANESLMADLIIGGDLWLNLDFIGGGVMVIPPTACNNDIQDLTGSGGRPIFFSNSTVNIQNAVYSEVVLCGADGAVLTNITAEGSPTLNNNGFLFMFTNHTSADGLSSDHNFFGISMYGAENIYLDNVNSTKSIMGLMSMGSQNTTVDHALAHSNRLNATLLFNFILGGGLGSSSVPDNFTAGVGYLIYQGDDIKINHSEFYNNTLGIASMSGSNIIVENTILHENDFFGFGAVNSTNISLANADVYNNTAIFPALESVPIPGMGSYNLSELAGEELSVGAAFIMSNHVSIIDSNFTGSTGGVALFQTDNIMVLDGEAHDNNLFGYAGIQFTNLTMVDVNAYDNNKTLFPNLSGLPPVLIPMSLEPFTGLPLNIGAGFMIGNNINVTDSNFSGSFAGALFVMASFNVTGGSAYDNDFAGYVSLQSAAGFHDINASNNLGIVPDLGDSLSALFPLGSLNLSGIAGTNLGLGIFSVFSDPMNISHSYFSNNSIGALSVFDLNMSIEHTVSNNNDFAGYLTFLDGMIIPSTYSLHNISAHDNYGILTDTDLMKDLLDGIGFAAPSSFYNFMAATPQGFGLVMFGSGYFDITDSNFTGSKSGVMLEVSRLNNISNSYFGNNTLSGLTAHFANATLRNNTFHNNLRDMILLNQSFIDVIGGSMHGSEIGYLINDSAGRITDAILYNHSFADAVIIASNNNSYWIINNVTFANSNGTLINSTVLSLVDNVSMGESYYINWTTTPVSIMPGLVAFESKFVDIDDSLGIGATIDTLIWHWNDSELNTATYNFTESRFEVWEYNSTGQWNLVPSVIDIAANTLNVTNLTPASKYGVLQNNLASCSEITFPGIYVLTANLTGQPINASPLFGTACIKITTDDVLLDCDNHTIIGTSVISTYGILTNGSGTNITIRNCNISNYGNGMYISSSTNLSAQNVSTWGNIQGIYLDSSSGNSFSEIISYNNLGTGLGLGKSHNNIFVNTYAITNAREGIALSQSHNNTFTGGEINFNNGYAVYISSSDNNTFSDMSLTRNDRGFDLSDSDGNTFMNSNLSSNNGLAGGGFYLDGSLYNVLDNNKVFNHTDPGFTLTALANFNNLTNNIAYNNSAGISLIANVRWNELIGNTVYNNTNYGIILQPSGSSPQYNTLQGNIVFNHTRVGIALDDSGNNYVIGNEVHDNRIGIGALNSTHDNSFANNTLYNNFMGIGAIRTGSGSFTGLGVAAQPDQHTGNVAYNNTIGVGIYNTNQIILRNNIVYNNVYGVYSNMSNQSRFINNTAYNNTYGFYLRKTHFTRSFVNNTAHNNSLYGMYLTECSGQDFNNFIILDNSKVYNNANNGIHIDKGFLIGVNNSELYDNGGMGVYVRGGTWNTPFGWAPSAALFVSGSDIHDNVDDGIVTENGFSVIGIGEISALGTVGNEIYNNGNSGITINSADYISVINNTIHNNRHGLRLSKIGGEGYPVPPPSVVILTIENNTIYSNTNNGFFAKGSINLTIINNIIHTNNVGMTIESSNNAYISNLTLYNHNRDFRARNYLGSPVNFTLDNVQFLNPSGTQDDYTVLSVSDVMADTEEYYINWSRNPTPNNLPINHSSFEDKFIDIDNLSATPIKIDTLIWHWNDSELGQYFNESTFEIWEYNSTNGWTNKNATLNNVTNTLNLSGLTPASTYGVVSARLPSVGGRQEERGRGRRPPPEPLPPPEPEIETRKPIPRPEPEPEPELGGEALVISRIEIDGEHIAFYDDILTSPVWNPDSLHEVKIYFKNIGPIPLTETKLVMDPPDGVTIEHITPSSITSLGVGAEAVFTVALRAGDIKDVFDLNFRVESTGASDSKKIPVKVALITIEQPFGFLRMPIFYFPIIMLPLLLLFLRLLALNERVKDLLANMLSMFYAVSIADENMLRKLIRERKIQKFWFLYVIRGTYIKYRTFKSIRPIDINMADLREVSIIKAKYKVDDEFASILHFASKKNKAKILTERAVSDMIKQDFKNIKFGDIVSKPVKNI